MATFTPNNAEVNEKIKLEKSLKENLEKERTLRLKSEIEQLEQERKRKQGNRLLYYPLGAKKLKSCGILEAYSCKIEFTLSNCDVNSLLDIICAYFYYKLYIDKLRSLKIALLIQSRPDA